MDVIGLFPNLKIEEILKILREMLLNSGIEFENVDATEVEKHLAVYLTRDEIEQLGLVKVVPKRKGAQRKVTLAYLDGWENNQ